MNLNLMNAHTDTHTHILTVTDSETDIQQRMLSINHCKQHLGTLALTESHEITLNPLNCTSLPCTVTSHCVKVFITTQQ